MIRKIIGFAFIFAFCAVFVSAQAQDGDDTGWITGKVTSIEAGQNDSLMSIELADGVIFNVAAANDLLGGIEAGDVVTVQITKGWADMVEVAEGEGIPTPAPESEKKGPQWVVGEVIAIQEGDTDTLISVKRPNGSVFNVAVANDKMAGVKLGSYVTIEIQKGWAKSVKEKE
jgi:molybdopterin-binding protein